MIFNNPIKKNERKISISEKFVIGKIENISEITNTIHKLNKPI
jgi:hypothetical protein